MGESGWRQVVKETVSKGSGDQVRRLGAALAYYTVFSLAPLALIAVAVVGLVFGDQTAEGAVFAELRQFMGPAQARAIEQLVISARRPTSGFWGAAGLAALLFGAGSVVGELQSALNQIFGAPVSKLGWLAAIKQRVISLGFVLSVGFLLLVSMLLSMAISAAGRLVSGLTVFSELVLHAANLAATFALVGLLFTMMFRYLPFCRIAWRDAWRGGAATSAMFLIGNLGLSLYLGKAGPMSAYGAAGSILAVLLWSYYCAQIFYWGAEFTQVYARRRGAGLSFQP